MYSLKLVRTNGLNLFGFILLSGFYIWLKRSLFFRVLGSDICTEYGIRVLVGCVISVI